MRLDEVVIPSNDQMTVAQQTALLSIYLGQATSPEVAAQSLKGDPRKLAAGEYLIHRKLIAPSATGVGITRRGYEQLIQMGLINQGQITPKGKALINPTQSKTPEAPEPTQPQGGIT